MTDSVLGDLPIKDVARRSLRWLIRAGTGAVVIAGLLLGGVSIGNWYGSSQEREQCMAAQQLRQDVRAETLRELGQLQANTAEKLDSIATQIEGEASASQAVATQAQRATQQAKSAAEKAAQAADKAEASARQSARQPARVIVPPPEAPLTPPVAPKPWDSKLHKGG